MERRHCDLSVWIRVGCCALVLSLAVGCAGTKQGKGRSASAQSARERLASSVAADAQKTAEKPPVPNKAPDNTAQNRGDEAPEAVTPIDQGDSDIDRRITQDLRRAIVSPPKGSPPFSFSAKNIKIITVNNEVTLRGVVSSDREKAAIDALARQLRGVEKVNNQLRVK